MGGAVGAGPIAKEVFKAAFPPGTFIRRDKIENTAKMDEEIPQSRETIEETQQGTDTPPDPEFDDEVVP